MESLLATPWHLDHWFSSDIQFHLLLPDPIRPLSQLHWTPLNVARRAAEYLATEDGVRILDIGSGVGKFCLSASYYKPKAFFDGVEQRVSLVEYAETARNVLGLFNASFIHGDFTQINLTKYNHFYFYNSFFENLDGVEKIDNSIAYSPALYTYYSGYLYKELERMPASTRIVTYCSWGDEIPPSYNLAKCEFDDLLKFYIKN
jgi:SAM-dependent methyltransferase